jgi:gamma-tubulin complex component 3
LANRLGDIFDCVLKYNVVLDHLYNYATVESGRMFPSNEPSDLEKIRRIRVGHQKMEDNFTSQVLQFLDVLKSYHDEDLRSLSTRLDYNDFYSAFDNTPSSQQQQS